MKTVIEMACDAGFTLIKPEWVFVDMIERFAELIRADEREVVEDLLKEYDMVNSAFARDFRARSNT